MFVDGVLRRELCVRARRSRAFVATRRSIRGLRVTPIGPDRYWLEFGRGTCVGESSHHTIGRLSGSRLVLDDPVAGFSFRVIYPARFAGEDCLVPDEVPGTSPMQPLWMGGRRELAFRRADVVEVERVLRGIRDQAK